MLLLLAGSSPMNIMQMEKEAKAEQVANREGRREGASPALDSVLALPSYAATISHLLTASIR